MAVEVHVIKSDTKVTWCPGCGDFGVLNATLKAIQAIQLDPKDLVVVSGIGCSSNFPHFLQSYGFHGIHGRVMPVATGIRLANPDLTVIATGGDGDGYGIGLGHFIHAMRRNFDSAGAARLARSCGVSSMRMGVSIAPAGIRALSWARSAFCWAARSVCVMPPTATSGPTRLAGRCALAVETVSESATAAVSKNPGRIRHAQCVSLFFIINPSRKKSGRPAKNTALTLATTAEGILQDATPEPSMVPIQPIPGFPVGPPTAVAERLTLYGKENSAPCKAFSPLRSGAL